jgi:hypothetical protein
VSTAEDIRETEGQTAAARLASALGALTAATEAAEVDPTEAAEALETQALADAIAILQDLRSRLVKVEADLSTALGRREGKLVGSLSDGRQFKLERSSDRKEWDHDDWKRDVRRAITHEVTAAYGSAPTVIDDEGEIVDLPLAHIIQTAVTAAQGVHGAQAPKSTALKALGLYATDYCTSTPGPWRFSAIKPDPPKDTTEKDTTDA